MKIAVVGCGAVGSFYGATLARAGQDVHFLLRSDYETVRRDGVRIHGPDGDFSARPATASSPGQIGLSDLVIVALKATANDQFQKLLPPLVSSNTAILTLQNGLGNEEDLARLFPAEQIMGGLCFVCLNRTAPGVIHHMDHGLITVGEFAGRPKPRTREIAATFQDAGIPCKVTENLARAHWEKLVWNIPFNGLGVAGAGGYGAFSADGAPANLEIDASGCLDTQRLLGDPRWAGLAKELMLEVIATAGKLGYPIEQSLADKQIERTRTMGPYKASTLIDFERGLPIELRALFLEPLARAKDAGVAVPRLERLCAILARMAP